MNNKDIKWISLQPLTGGMYIGFENAIGHPAECIISFKGLNDYSESKSGRGRAGNEYNLTQYLKEHNRDVPYYVFNSNMFDSNIKGPDIEFSDIDIVCSVPVCSGLSMLTSTDSADKALKNNNMKLLALYAIETIKPKVYVFENAPGLLSQKGLEIRVWMNKLAQKNGYNVSYFKTDSIYHHNCQKRPRTFVIMSKDASILDNIFEHETKTFSEVLSNIPEDSLYQDSYHKPLYENEVYIAYAKEEFGTNWKEAFSGDILNKIIRNKKLNDFKKWCETTDKVENKDFLRRMIRYVSHVQECINNGKGWWSACPHFHKEYAPAVQSRTIYSTIHPTEDRLCSERDMLTLMGMPYDFNMKGNFDSDGRKIGQNVPVKTSEWIARISLQLLNDSSSHRKPVYYNNIDKTITQDK